MRLIKTLFVPVTLMAATAGVLYGQQQSASTVATKATFERLCGTCHEPERSTSTRRTREQWLQTVNQMVARGAEGTDDELMGVVEYLAREHGRVNVNLAAAADIALVLGLSPAEGAAIVQYRRERGTFEDAAGVAKVPGVDPAKLAARAQAMVFGSKVTPSAGRVPVSALTAANNWPSVNGGPQRESWARPEAMLSRDTASAIKLIYARTLDDRNRVANALTPPLVLGNLISYRGFKEMLFLGGRSDDVYSIDAVLNRIIWTAHLPSSATQPPRDGATPCAGGLMGIVMSGTASGGLAGAGGIRRGGPAPAAAGAAATGGRNGLVVGLASGFGRNGLLLAVSSDGNVHALYQSNGANFEPPMKFLPPNSRVNGLNLYDNTLYAATIDGCAGPNAVYAIDLASDQRTVMKFETNGAGATGSAGTAIGNDGTVYVQVAEGHGEAGGQYNDTVLALTPKDLKVKDYFTPSAAVAPVFATSQAGATPAVFRWNGKDVVVAGSRDGRVFLLDASALGGADHRTPLAESRPIGATSGAFTSWEDPETGTRWIYATLPRASSDGTGAIAAFKLEERNGRPALTLAWTSRALIAPSAPVVANGLLFALSAGGSSTRATLYALDAATGKELFTSGDTVTRPASAQGAALAVANGRVYFTTQDNTVYSFGIATEH